MRLFNVFVGGFFFYGKALDNNDLDQVYLTRGFVKRRVYWGGGGGRVLSLAGS